VHFHGSVTILHANKTPCRNFGPRAPHDGEQIHGREINLLVAKAKAQLYNINRLTCKLSL
jgi:hypothetical protein